MMTTKHTRQHPWRTAAALLLAWSLAACSTPPGQDGCPTDSKPDSLNGLWTVELAGNSQHWTLRLAPHPEHIGSWRGELVQGPQRFAVVADLDGGEFTMEETHDGVRIAATWLGTALVQACTRTIQGQRFENDQSGLAFSLQAASEDPKK
jgi:hypothetical protein